MKINEVIMEHGGMEKIDDTHRAAIRNAITFPDQNMNSGSAYKHYRFGLALAGAPDYPTKADNYIAGDPLLSPYTKEEMDMVNAAALAVGDGSKQTWSNGRSEEIAGVNKQSTVAPKKKNKYGV